MSTRITVNGEFRLVDAGPDTPLLYVLRNDLGLNGPKFGCGLGQCGACAAIVAGNLVRTCSTLLRDVGNDHVTTLEGLGSLENPHALQKAFIAEQAAQCGYCTNGIIIAAKTGSKYVQSRTAAGGQSQQRFACRRANQADAMAEAVAEQARLVFAGRAFEYILPGGDRGLVDNLLAHPALKPWAGLPRLAYLDVPDPRAAVVKKAAVDACSIRVTVTDPPAA